MLNTDSEAGVKARIANNSLASKTVVETLGYLLSTVPANISNLDKALSTLTFKNSSKSEMGSIVWVSSFLFIFSHGIFSLVTMGLNFEVQTRTGRINSHIVII